MSGFDAIVVGLGAHGSASLYHLARSGGRVLGIDRLDPPHELGSSHGETRITRKAYWEGERYLPLLERSYALWEALEAETGRVLKRPTGGLMLGPEDAEVVAGARHTAEERGLPYELLTSAQVRLRFPAFRLPEGQVGLWEPQAAVLDPEACISAHLTEARRLGAEFALNTSVTAWHRGGAGVELALAGADGTVTTHSAGAVLFATGAWMGQSLPELAPILTVERQVSAWWRPAGPPERFGPDAHPIYMWEYEPGHQLYGFPDLGHGVKHGLHHNGETSAAPDGIDREVHPADLAAIREPLDRLIPGSTAHPIRAVTCLYTNTPDHHYALGPMPGEPGVWVASACSGHGFKACNAIGESLSAAMLGDTPPVDLTPFGLERFQESA